MSALFLGVSANLSTRLGAGRLPIVDPDLSIEDANGRSAKVSTVPVASRYHRRNSRSFGSISACHSGRAASKPAAHTAIYCSVGYLHFDSEREASTYFVVGRWFDRSMAFWLYALSFGDNLYAAALTAKIMSPATKVTHGLLVRKLPA